MNEQNIFLFLNFWHNIQNNGYEQNNNHDLNKQIKLIKEQQWG